MFKVVAAAAAFSFFALAASVPPVDAASRAVTPAGGKNVYLVMLRDLPTGSARKPARGMRLNKADPAVATYSTQLKSRHDALLSAVGGARKLYSYSYALNGFAAELSEVQVQKLRADPNVIGVVPNAIRKMDTLTTPAFLGLNAPNGIWDQLGGGAHAGDNVIVGVIDSGIWPENPSFAPRPVHAGPPPGWNGVCQEGEQFPASTCNDKIIGARWFNAGFGGDAGVKSLFTYEFASARAADGHGTHTAGTAVGNYRVNATSGGIHLGRISGMAPAARLAVYKACWGYEEDTGAGCAIVDTVAAIDQAVADGVDVINFSITGSPSSFIDPVEFAFLIAADAGVFVATSAGNTGALGAGSVNHISPWVTTVAAGTHDRRYDASVIFTSGARFRGTSLHDVGLPNHNLVLASNAGLAGQNPAEVALCFPGTLNPAKVADKIVVCDRGINPRAEKSVVVSDAGGVGMVLVNTSPNTLNADITAIPTAHVDDVVGAALKNFLAGHVNQKARLTPGTRVTGVPAPNMLKDSSRGPAIAGNGDILKPDVLAPGVDILAAVSPVKNGLDFDFALGTSMSSAHVAGLGALLKQAHPDWSPMAIKSALMTTATTRRNDGARIGEEDGVAPANALAYGAGFVQTNKALDPGLVYDSNSTDWFAFLCGTGQACFPPLAAIDPSDLNTPSISIGSLVGYQIVKRTVTNVSAHRSHYKVDWHAPPGVRMQVWPRQFTIQPGATKTYYVGFLRSGATLDQFTLGSLIWSDGTHSVRSAIALRPEALTAPAEVSGTRGRLKYSVDFGYNGPFKAAARGLIPALTNAGGVADDPANEINTALATGVGVTVVPVLVPAGTTYARFSLFDANTDGADDLDLYLFRSNGTFVVGSANGGANEEIDLTNPAPDIYLLAVHGFETDGPDAQFTLFSWALGNTPAGNVSVTAPARASANRKGRITLDFSNLQHGVKYLGSIAYEGAVNMPPPTIVRVDR